jgi:antitoxin HigA-1
MANNGMHPVHPGEILRQDVLEELGLSANALARALHVPANRITAILHERRGITADTALRLARFLGTTPQFWLNLQTAYELRTAEETTGSAVRDEVQPFEGAA